MLTDLWFSSSKCVQDNITGNKIILCLLRRKMKSQKTLTVLGRETKRNLIVKAKKATTSLYDYNKMG